MMITHKYLLRRLLGVILIGMGVVLAAGKICLATLGGSFYYICIEASLVAAGLLDFPRASAGAVPLRGRGDHESGLGAVGSRLRLVAACPAWGRNRRSWYGTRVTSDRAQPGTAIPQHSWFRRMGRALRITRGLPWHCRFGRLGRIARHQR